MLINASISEMVDFVIGIKYSMTIDRVVLFKLTLALNNNNWKSSRILKIIDPNRDFRLAIEKISLLLGNQTFNDFYA